jgi:hypothetical protein
MPSRSSFKHGLPRECESRAPDRHSAFIFSISLASDLAGALNDPGHRAIEPKGFGKSFGEALLLEIEVLWALVDLPPDIPVACGAAGKRLEITLARPNCTTPCEVGPGCSRRGADETRWSKCRSRSLLELRHTRSATHALVTLPGATRCCCRRL